MATLKLSNQGDGYVQWTISGLGNNFTTANGYISAGITEYRFTQSNPSIYGVVSEVWAGTSGEKSVTGSEYVGAGFHEYWGFTQGDSMYYPAGHATVTITEGPDYDEFSWTYAGLNVSTGTPVAGTRKRGGLGVYVTAEEWNELIDNANERLGKAMGHVRQGETISASVVNTLARALDVGTVSSGDPIRAAFFNQLMDAVNNAG